MYTYSSSGLRSTFRRLAAAIENQYGGVFGGSRGTRIQLVLSRHDTSNDITSKGMIHTLQHETTLNRKVREYKRSAWKLAQPRGEENVAEFHSRRKKANNLTLQQALPRKGPKVKSQQC